MKHLNVLNSNTSYSYFSYLVLCLVYMFEILKNTCPEKIQKK